MTTTSYNFTISERAAKRINLLIKQENLDGCKLRISILGGGCSGFQYNFEFDSTVNDDDSIFSKNDSEVIIDEISLDMLSGSELDFVEKLGGSTFTIVNPNATANCGCGNSFSV